MQWYSSLYDMGAWNVTIKLCVTYIHKQKDACVSTGSTKCLTYMQGCHLTNRYKECVRVYSNFVDTFHDPSELRKASCLKAKALYNIYIDEQMQLHENADMMSPKDISQKHEECYKKVKELIILLGDLVDDLSLESDEEIQIMLDSAMMDYIHETNKLHEIQRCYLCCKKVISKTPHEQDTEEQKDVGVISQQLSADVPSVTRMYNDLTIGNVLSITQGENNSLLQEKIDKKDSQHDKHSRKRGPMSSAISVDGTDTENPTDMPTSHKKAKYSGTPISEKHPHPTTLRRDRSEKLIRSHLFPKAILERFAHAVPLPPDARVIIGHMPGLAMQRKYRNSLVSPRQSTLFMLCSTCENTLSGHGETQFVSQFFDKLYDTKNSSQSTGEQVIKYSKELYNFCVGMIFRTLYWPKGKYTNENELYQLLQRCRRFLLNVQSRSPPNSEDIPDIFILISPLSAKESELSHGFMNSVLSGTCLAITTNSSLSTGEMSPKTTIQSQYCLIHIGAINILVKLAPSKDVELPIESLINPHGGNYHIPPESVRKDHLPQGIWSLFQLLAQRNEKQWLEASESQYMSFEKKTVNQPDASAAIAYGITGGRDTELNTFTTIGLQPSSDPNTPKVINFLPNQFCVRPYQQQTLELPPGHRMLLHETAGDGMSGNTIFVAVETDGTSHSSNKPYVIWHYYNQGIQINFGFFIAMSHNSLNAGEFLVNTKEKFRVEHFPEVIQTRNNASNILPGVLQAKGFFNLQSLMNRVIVLRLAVTNHCMS